MAPPLHDAFEGLRTAGRVNVMAGRIVQIREQSRDDNDASIVVRVRPRASREIRQLAVGAVVNCSGPSGDTRKLRDALFDRLRLQGLVRPDPLGLGIEVGAHGALVDNDGFESPLLYYVGPFLRARDWEATAVPELRVYARRLAHHLLETLNADDTNARARSTLVTASAPAAAPHPGQP